MQMQQIHYFLALCEDRNFTRAARRCGVSQPSLTRAIKLLELELGGTLFLRGKRTTDLSPLGAVMQPCLQQINQAVTAAMQTAEKATAVWAISHADANGHAHDVGQAMRVKRNGGYDLTHAK